MTAVIQDLNSELARLSEQVHASLVRVESGCWGPAAPVHEIKSFLKHSMQRSARLPSTHSIWLRTPYHFLQPISPQAADTYSS